MLEWLTREVARREGILLTEIDTLEENCSGLCRQNDALLDTNTGIGEERKLLWEACDADTTEEALFYIKQLQEAAR